MTVPTPIPQRQTPHAELVAIEEKDVSEVASFIAAQSGQLKEAVGAHLRWFLLENPARQSQDPLGFGLRAADQLAGCILCSPQIFRLGKGKILLMGSSLFYVDDRYRGYGGRIFLQYCRLGNRRPLFGTSANPEAAALWKAAGATPIPYSDCELLGVLHWPPIVEEAVHRRFSNRLLSGLARSRVSRIAEVFRPLKLNRTSSATLRPLTAPEQANDLLANGLLLNEAQPHPPAAKLTAARDLPYIRWRYFSGRDATVEVFAFRSRAQDHEILVTVNRRIRGYRQQIKTLNVLDVYPEVSPDDSLRIVGTLIARYGEKVDAVVLRSQNPEQQRMLCERGFRRRVFDAPIGWFLDRSKLLPTREWYPVPADGDGLI